MGVTRAEAAIALAVGEDILAGHKDQFKPYPRVVNWLAYIGANSAGESRIDVFVGDMRYATEIANSSTGLVIDMNKDVVPVRIPIPAGQLLRIVVTKIGSVSVTTVYFNTVP